jgi:hypothetical protein
MKMPVGFVNICRKVVGSLLIQGFTLKEPPQSLNVVKYITIIGGKQT